MAPAHWLDALLDTVEVNYTFHRPASPAAVGRWLERTPEHFAFALKANRYLTHRSA
ncbi:MAG: hypothetical protein NVSMB25_10530 [Thermoleophilaceae bacterium]